MTNKFNLPRIVVRAVEHLEQLRKDSTSIFPTDCTPLSVSDIASDPAYWVIKHCHKDAARLTDDAYEHIVAAEGSAMHMLLEEAAKTMSSMSAEERLSIHTPLMVDGKSIVLHGQYDFFDKYLNTLSDLKFTSSYVFKNKDYGNYRLRLSLYAYLLKRVKGKYDIEIENILWFKDWNTMEYGYQENYPPTKIQTVRHELMSDDEVEDYVSAWVTKADCILTNYALTGELLRPCEPDFRWKTEDKYRVLKNGNVKAKVFDTLENAELFAKSSYKNDGYTITVERGIDKKCAGFILNGLHVKNCDVCHVCPYGKQQVATLHSDNNIEYRTE